MIKKLIYLIAFFFLLSCSDSLSHGKAKRLIKDCLANNPKTKTMLLQHGNIWFDTTDKTLTNYKKLADEGFLILTPTDETSAAYPNLAMFHVKLTDKTNSFIVTEEDVSKTALTDGLIRVKIYEYEIDKIKSIHEIPSLNTADVQVVYKITNRTPFSILSLLKPEEKTTTEEFTKTNEGWRFCEEE